MPCQKGAKYGPVNIITQRAMQRLAIAVAMPMQLNAACTDTAIFDAHRRGAALPPLKRDHMSFNAFAADTQAAVVSSTSSSVCASAT